MSFILINLLAHTPLLWYWGFGVAPPLYQALSFYPVAVTLAFISPAILINRTKNNLVTYLLAAGLIGGIIVAIKWSMLTMGSDPGAWAKQGVGHLYWVHLITFPTFTAFIYLEVLKSESQKWALPVALGGVFALYLVLSDVLRPDLVDKNLLIDYGLFYGLIFDSLMPTILGSVLWLVLIYLTFRYR